MSGWLNDDSGQGHSPFVRAYGTGSVPYYDTNDKKFGSSSVKLNRVDNNNGGTIQVADSADWQFGSGDFCIQFWIKIPSIGDTQRRGYIQQHRDYGDTYRRSFMFAARDDSLHNVEMKLLATDLSGYETSFANSAIDNNTWRHVLMSRNGGYIHCFTDGYLRGRVSYTKALSDSPQELSIGSSHYVSDDNLQARGFSGARMDALHIEKGIANYTGSSVGVQYFTPPTNAPTATAYSVLLMNFNEQFYQIQGTLSDEARVTVIDFDSRTVEHDAVESAGAYAIDVDDSSVKLIVAERVSDGKALAYGQVVPTLL